MARDTAVMEAPDAFEELLRSHLAPWLKSKGFRRDGDYFWRWRPEGFQDSELCQILHFQRGKWNTKERCEFTIDLEIFSRRVYRLLQNEEFVGRFPKPSKYGWQFGKRLTRLLPGEPEQWWTIESEEQIPELVGVLIPALEHYALPEFEKYDSDRALRDLWLSEIAPGISEGERLVFLAFLLLELGPDEDLAPVLARLEGKGETWAKALEYKRKIESLRAGRNRDHG